MNLQNLNKKQPTRFDLWKSHNTWENQLGLKQNWLDKSKPAYIK